MEWRLPPGIELRSIDNVMEPGPHDGRSSISPSLSQMTSPTSLLPDEIYQLTILWRGIWTMLNQRRQQLEAIRDIWGAFESRKEAFSSCLVKAEDRLSSLFTTLSGSKDLAVIQAEFTAQQVCVFPCLSVCPTTLRPTLAYMYSTHKTPPPPPPPPPPPTHTHTHKM